MDRGSATKILIRFFLLSILILTPLLGGTILPDSCPRPTYAAKRDPSYQVSLSPTRLQEGSNTTITVNVLGATTNTALNVNVTDPRGVSYAKYLAVTINATGFGSNSTQYWGNFAGANTEFVGIYTAAANNTLASASFKVGLTDKTQYRRREIVSMRAVGYRSRENVTISLSQETTEVEGFPKNVMADTSGHVNATWTIPSNATLGVYQIGIENATDLSPKLIPDVDTFEVGFICSVKAVNLENEAVNNATVEAYNATSKQNLESQGVTNSSGWAQFRLDVGNYTFRTFVREVEVGDLFNQTLNENSVYQIQLRLVNIVTTVKTESGEPVPFIDIALRYNVTTRSNQTVSYATPLQTNITGEDESQNLFTNITYRVEATRYGMLFSNTTLNVTATPISPLDLVLTLPTYTLNIHALDSKGLPANGIEIKVYDWASGLAVPLQSTETDNSGNTSFSLPFGRYLVESYIDGYLVNATVVNLIENPQVLALNLLTANVDATVTVHDYFGHPIANAEVKIERKTGQEYVLIKTQSTGGSGSTTFTSIVGGNCQISVYVNGRLSDVANQLLAAGSNHVTLSAMDYVALLGYPVQTGLFAFVCFIIVLIVLSLVLMRRRVTSLLWRKRKA
jgi:5-hydroxyisourate hydrolase-like protein (transthyretin family)